MSLSNELAQVEKLIIHFHRELFEESISAMKLQKLCYYAQGYALAEKQQLFPEDFQAWQHGPVIPNLYQKYKHYKWHPIEDKVEIETNHPQYELIESIVDAYGRYDGAALSTMTHREKPWIEARKGIPETDGSQEIISKESLQNFFSAKVSTYV